MAAHGQAALVRAMDLDLLITHYFGTDDVVTLTPEQLADGVDQLRLQLGLERDAGRRFALWCLLYILGSAPDLNATFKDENDRNAARDFMDTVDREEQDDS
jgi:hypothetical protein